jgi:uncharacterized damage-inducible protein DinB
MTSPATNTQESFTSRSTLSPKARFLKSFEQEAATTLRVLRAYPADKCSLQPHERCKTALQLAWLFVMEQMMLVRALKGEPPFGGNNPKTPEAWSEVIEAYEKSRDELIAQLRDPGNANLDGAVPFFVGPKQPGDIPLGEFVWFLLHDQIHHRGQLSVYLRMAGGKVPSIYGPTADEPWN